MAHIPFLDNLWNQVPAPCAAENYTYRESKGEGSSSYTKKTLTIESLLEPRRKYSDHEYAGYEEMELNIAVYAVLGLLNKDRLDAARAAWKPFFREFRVAAEKAEKELFPIMIPPHRFLAPKQLDNVLANLCALVGRRYELHPFDHAPLEQYSLDDFSQDCFEFTGAEQPRIIGYKDFSLSHEGSPLCDFTPQEQESFIHYFQPSEDFILGAVGLSDFLLNLIFQVFQGNMFSAMGDGSTLILRQICGSYMSARVFFEGDYLEACGIEGGITDESIDKYIADYYNDKIFDREGFRISFHHQEPSQTYSACRLRYALNRRPFF